MAASNTATESSLPTLRAVEGWTESIQPALDIIFKAPKVPNAEAGTSSLPSLTAKQYADAYSAVYLVSTSSRPAGSQDSRGRKPVRFADLLYDLLDEYFAALCADAVATITVYGANPLLASYLDAYERYSSALPVASRLFAYSDRHFIKRERVLGHGWVTPSARALARREKLETIMNGIRHDSLVNDWGMPVKHTEKEEAEAELRAEVASTPDRLVSLTACALRRWRLDVVGPLSGKEGGDMKLDALLAGDSEAASQRASLESLAGSLASVGVLEDDRIRIQLAAALA